MSSIKWDLTLCGHVKNNFRAPIFPNAHLAEIFVNTQKAHSLSTPVLTKQQALPLSSHTMQNATVRVFESAHLAFQLKRLKVY